MEGVRGERGKEEGEREGNKGRKKREEGKLLFTRVLQASEIVDPPDKTPALPGSVHQ